MDAAEQAVLEQELAEQALLLKQNQLLLEEMLSNWAKWGRWAYTFPPAPLHFSLPC